MVNFDKKVFLTYLYLLFLQDRQIDCMLIRELILNILIFKEKVVLGPVVYFHVTTKFFFTHFSITLTGQGQVVSYSSNATNVVSSGCKLLFFI